VGMEVVKLKNSSEITADEFGFETSHGGVGLGKRSKNIIVSTHHRACEGEREDDDERRRGGDSEEDGALRSLSCWLRTGIGRHRGVKDTHDDATLLAEHYLAMRENKNEQNGNDWLERKDDGAILTPTIKRHYSIVWWWWWNPVRQVRAALYVK
jgi:hypothetical protein